MVSETQELKEKTAEEELDRHFKHLKFLASAILLFCGISIFFVFDLGTFTIFELPRQTNFTVLGIILSIMSALFLVLMTEFYKTKKDIDEVESSDEDSKE